jgi:hypothetical protein
MQQLIKKGIEENIISVLGSGFANIIFCVITWFYWMFGGLPQKRADISVFVTFPLVMTLIPGMAVTLIVVFSSMSLKYKLGHALAALLPPLLYFALQAVRLYGEPLPK